MKRKNTARGFRAPNCCTHYTQQLNFLPWNIISRARGVHSMTDLHSKLVQNCSENDVWHKTCFELSSHVIRAHVILHAEEMKNTKQFIVSRKRECIWIFWKRRASSPASTCGSCGTTSELGFPRISLDPSTGNTRHNVVGNFVRSKTVCTENVNNIILCYAYSCAAD